MEYNYLVYLHLQYTTQFGGKENNPAQEAEAAFSFRSKRKLEAC